MVVSDLVSISNQLLPEPYAGLLSGILFGTKATLASELKEVLLATGTIHITALSGMNITIISGIVTATLCRYISRRKSALLSAGIIIGYIAFVGMSPSVVRAGIMGILAQIAIVLGKNQWPIYTLGLTVALMLIYNFEWIGDIGFQLSVLATLGIILFGREKNNLHDRPNEYVVEKSIYTQMISHSQKLDRVKQGIQIFYKIIKDDLRITLAAQILTTPLILFIFRRVSLIAPLANIAITWTIAPLTVIGSIAIILGYIWLPLGYPLAWVCYVLLKYMVSILHVFANMPLSSLKW